MKNDAIRENKARENEIVENLEALARLGRLSALAGLHRLENRNAFLKKQTEKALIAGIRVCGKRDMIDDVAALLKKDGLSNAVMFAALDACEKYGKVYEIVSLLDKDGLSNGVMRRVIRFCKNEGRIGYLAGLLDKNLSASLRKEAEASLIRGIKVCERNGWVLEVADLLGRKNISEKVRKIALDVVRKNSISTTRDLLLDDTVKPPAKNRQKTLPQEMKPKKIQRRI